MIKIIIIEDEPSAMRYLQSVIHKKCHGFEVIATAKNGLEGIKVIRSLKPDIIITDIKMPEMNGIELASIIKDEFPFIYSIIVSGYQDFEYTKGAIQSDVVDYLLKPVNVKQLQKLLDSLKHKIETDYYDKRVELLRKALNSRNMEVWERHKYLPFQKYRVAVLRQNGLPSRFVSKQVIPRYNSITELYSLPPGIVWNEDIWTMVGRDEMELIFFCASKAITQGEFSAYVTEIGKCYDSGYYTIAMSDDAFSFENSRDIIYRLYYIINNNISIGLSQLIQDDNERQGKIRRIDRLDGDFRSKINYLIFNALYDELRTELIKLFQRWSIEKPIQLSVESSLRQIFNEIQKHNQTILEDDLNDIEILLDEALYLAPTLDEVLNNVLSIVDKMTKSRYRSDQKMDTPEFFESIEEYLKTNIEESHSLLSLCKRFGVSQTYLSRLFRKNIDMSFNEYLTKLRIDKAKGLIAESPNMLLKDVAQQVGYNDPFYFSRVFRMITGIAPSEFRQ